MVKNKIQKMKNIITFCFAGLMLSLASCNQPSQYGLAEKDKESLIKTHDEVTKSAHENPQGINWDDFVKAHYAEDAIVMPPNGPSIEGHTEIIKTFKSWPPLTKFHTKDVEIDGSGNIAYIRGTYELTMKLNDTTEVSENGKYIELWKMNDKGEWKCIRDIFNSDMPLEE